MSEIVRVTTIKDWEKVRGLQVAVIETVAQPSTISVVILDTFEGLSEITHVDSSDPGARARAISLADLVHDALSVAECTWFDPVTGDPA